MIELDPLFMLELESDAATILERLSDLADGLDGMEHAYAVEALRQVNLAVEAMEEADMMIKGLVAFSRKGSKR